MRISLSTPIIVTTEDGDVVCNEVETSIAISNSVAVRLVPVDINGIEYSNFATGIVGTSDQEDIAIFMEETRAALEVLISNRGL